MADDEGQIRVLLADMEAGYRAKDAEQIVDETMKAAVDLAP
jgi:hypothetical protein